MSDLTEYQIIRSAVKILATQCAGNETKIIDLLTGYLWDEEEAGSIKALGESLEAIKAWNTRTPNNSELLVRIEALTEHKSPVSEHPFYLFKDEVIEAIKILGEGDE